MVLWRPTRPFKLTPQKRCLFHYRRLECKTRKSRNTWGNRHIWPWNVEWSRVKDYKVLPRECTGHSKHPLPTTQEKILHMDITRWSNPILYYIILYDYIIITDYILCSQRWRSFIQSAKTRPGSDCDSDHELLFLFFFFWMLLIIYFFSFILIYNTVLVLPYIDMNPPWVYMRSQTWTPHPPPSP